MKKMALITTMILCLVLTACGNKEESQTAQEEVSVENTVVEEIPEEVVEETEEVESTVEEENIGDVDFTGDISVADMSILIPDLDIEFETEEFSELYSKFGAEVQLLFPGGAYITAQDKGWAKAELTNETISIQISMHENGFASNDDRYTIEEVGKYTLEYTTNALNKYSFMREYRICNNKDLAVDIILTVNKTGDKDIADALIEEYVPAFEETLKNCLK